MAKKKNVCRFAENVCRFSLKTPEIPLKFHLKLKSAIISGELWRRKKMLKFLSKRLKFRLKPKPESAIISNYGERV